MRVGWVTVGFFKLQNNSLARGSTSEILFGDWTYLSFSLPFAFVLVLPFTTPPPAPMILFHSPFTCSSHFYCFSIPGAVRGGGSRHPLSRCTLIVLKVTRAEHMGQSTVKSESAFDDVVSSGYEMLDKWCKSRGYENEIGRDLTVFIIIVVVVVQLLLP